MKKKFLAFGLAAAMVLGSAFSTFAATEDNTVDRIVYSSTEDVALDGTVSASDAIENPLKGLETDKIVIEYTLTSEASLAAWKTVAQFYSDGDEGWAAGVCLTYWPQMAHNGNNLPIAWFELKGSNSNDSVPADTLCDGQAHTYKYVLTKSSCVITIDGEEKTIKTASDGNKTLEEICEVIFNELVSADKFTLGQAVPGNQDWGELVGTVNNFKITATVAADEDPTGEQPTTQPSPGGDKKPETGDKPTPKPTEPDSSNGGNEPNPGEDETTAPSPNGGNEEAVKATVVTAEAAKAVAEAAKVTNADGKVLDVVLTATPVEDTAAVAGLIAENADLAKAEVKAFAVLDLELKVGDKKVTYLDSKINVTVPMDKIFTDIKADDTIAVYRVDKDMAFSFLGMAKVTGDKTITFATDHFTQYAFVVVGNAEALKDVKVVEYKDVDPEATPDVAVKDIPVKADASGKPSDKPTGDTTPVMPLVVLAVIALGGVVAVAASKKRA